MEQEYTISTGWKIFMITVAVFLIAFSLFLFSMGEGHANSPLIFLMPITIIIGAVWIIAQQIRKKLIITDDTITRINAFSTVEISIKDIKGCRVGEKVIYIETSSADNPKVTINNYDSLSNSDELAKYFKEKFKNLDLVDLEAAKEKVLNDNSLGFTQEEREKKLKNAKIIAWIYNIVGFILGLSLIFADNTALVVIVLLCYPVLSIIIMLFSKGLVKFLSNSKISVYGFTMLGFLLPSFVLLLKSLSEYTVNSYSHLWLPFFVISSVFFAVLYIIGINKTVASITGQAAIMLIASLIYGFGSTRQINCAFDKSTPKLIHSTINSKWIEQSKGTHYHLKINSWDADLKPKDIEVSEDIYDKYSTGNTIDVELKSGLLNIPWFYINE